jgi:hypothetical protein
MRRSLGLSPVFVGGAKAVDAGAVGTAAVTVGLVVTVCWVSGFWVTTVCAPAAGLEFPAGVVVVVIVTGLTAVPVSGVQVTALPDAVVGTKPAGQVTVIEEVETPLAGVVVTVPVLGLLTVLTIFGVGLVVTCALRKELEDVIPWRLVNAALMLAGLKPLRDESSDAVKASF